MKRVCVVVGSRANYSSIKSVMRAVQQHENLDLLLVVAASALLDRYGAVVDLVEADGFEVITRIHMLIEGETPMTMAKSTGLGLIELATAFENLKPDIVVTVGDRFETMATTLAAAYMNIPIAHTMGGEVTGTIDESIRHAVTKFSHLHFPASPQAKERIIRMGESPEYVHCVGCPRIDLVAEILEQDGGLTDDFLHRYGVGPMVDLDKPFVLVSQHPVTTEYGMGELQIQNTLRAVHELDLPAIVLWPNADAGSDDIARGIRKWREHEHHSRMHFFKNLPTDLYIKLMDRAGCLVGNSSSGIREGAYIGIPVVNIGTRQVNRERGENVLDVGYEKDEIKEAIQHQMSIRKYPSNPLYGKGDAGAKIAGILATQSPVLQKRMSY